jgi:hypothetical protein
MIRKTIGFLDLGSYSGRCTCTRVRGHRKKIFSRDAKRLLCITSC